ncbi:FAD-dependent oxidoreductase [Phytoactinopolyspora mesophila]|uniref:D-amino-acid oxidase n=1 Tax=Phytoactinopolyspora mesophila TaxID=2650750 RepID=A0A7K3MCU1_9ACTN|nr:FAD-dependent oxidoreductase [Phytoactinopolyspora mesophila]NDL61113.1 FAD-dependent oxidoreductase [Phytoactinopolyspora mesophila]
MTAQGTTVVLGAGVAGLTTAVVLAEAGIPVRVVAEEIPGATSLAAGAMWGPYLVEPKDLVDQWSQHSLVLFRALASDPATGVRVASGIEASRHTEAAPDWATSLPGFRPAKADELPPGFSSGYRFTAPLIDMPTYLRYLEHRLRRAGGTIEQQTVHTLDAAPRASAIVNCTGMGAGSLTPDSALRPIRGQHVVVTNPGLTDFFSEDTGTSPDLLCIYPHGNTVVLGGTAIDGDASQAPDEQAAADILARCSAVEPRLAGSTVIGQRVGLRPTRDRVRVALDQRSDGTPVVHNYGHGGAGVTLSWGCAREVHHLLAESHRLR